MAYPVAMDGDETTIQYRSPSRSEQRRQALDVLALAGQLLQLGEGRLNQLPISAELRAHIITAKRITSHIARKRQLGFVAKQMRREDAETIAAIHDALDSSGQTARQHNAQIHHLEHWRDRLLNEGDGALGEFLATHSGIDPQPLRQLIRRAREERRSNTPPRAARALFAQLRQILG